MNAMLIFVFSISFHVSAPTGWKFSVFSMSGSCNAGRLKSVAIPTEDRAL